MELKKDTEFEKYLHCKIQNANESFNGTIWESILRNTSTALSNLEFGVYDAVAYFNIGIKASVLVYEKDNFTPGIYMQKSCVENNIKRLNLANQQACLKNKLRQKVLWAGKMSKNDNLLEKEGHLYVPRKF